MESVPGPILFLVYTFPLGAIPRRHGAGFHMYADDTQLYLSMKTTQAKDVVSVRTRVEVCLRELNMWMLLNNLWLNNDKTELLVMHAKHRPKPPLDSISMGDATTQIRPNQLRAIFIFLITPTKTEQFLGYPYATGTHEATKIANNNTFFSASLCIWNFSFIISVIIIIIIIIIRAEFK